MIKGKKISDINIKITSNVNTLKGAAQGNAFAPQKVQIMKNQNNRNHQNEEDIENHAKAIEKEEDNENKINEHAK